ncbi:ATP-binding protein [Novipirellula sp.]|uniref:ATP-binding protein n=1 Tax=Novipirellula sp. TaxID=2795430 RepID=UPI0035699CA9
MDFQPSNPFCTRFVRPGAIGYRFDPQQDAEPLVAAPTLAAPTLAALVRRICDPPFQLIVGPHGSGKSTLIRELVPRLSSHFAKVVEIQLHQPEHHYLTSPQTLSPENASTRGWFSASAERLIHSCRMAKWVAAKQREARPNGLLIIDGLEQLSWWSVDRIRRRAKRWGQTVLATSHRQHRGFATLRNTTLDADQIIALTQSLIASLATSEQTQVRRELDRRSLGPQTNLRDLWFDLYDLIETSRRQQHARSLERRDRSIAPHS